MTLYKPSKNKINNKRPDYLIEALRHAIYNNQRENNFTHRKVFSCGLRTIPAAFPSNRA